ncbi:heavy-metal-associated domain-containing protein [Olsenella sp. Marseille-P4559]|jgi:copper chaperone CopZ|uniref:heavy-metal-associated domain-containing protein n=1 Tax=Olsenella sp. Marseille-P4559 TaxID=2364795 RepID=UPI0010317EB8|nr:heavy metal-associated domain-containing protein [Olsenella sp. Marseille-P4559]
MKPVDVILIAAVIAILAVAIRRFIGTATGTRDCCSGAKKKSNVKRFKATKIEDTNESHYPYQADFEIGGMSCEHCAESVTRALDSIDGTWATVSLAGGRAHVRSKSPINEDVYRKVVEEAGYRLVG